MNLTTTGPIADEDDSEPVGVLVAVSLSVLGFTFLAALVIFWGLSRSEKRDNWGGGETRGARLDVQQEGESDEEGKERMQKEEELRSYVDIVMPREKAAAQGRIAQSEKRKIGKREEEEFQKIRKIWAQQTSEFTADGSKTRTTSKLEDSFSTLTPVITEFSAK